VTLNSAQLIKTLHRSNLLPEQNLQQTTRDFLSPVALSLLVAFGFSASPALADSFVSPKQNVAKPAPVHSTENYKDLIVKAQNLTLQRDRLQATQVLIRGISRETKNSLAYRELVKALDDLSSVFYTEKAQTLFVAGDSMLLLKPKEAVEPLQDALHLEDGNLAILKVLIRAHLINTDCAKAETHLRSAETIHPFSSEIKLLRLQTLRCMKSYDALAAKLSEPDLESILPYIRGMQIEDALRKDDLKKAKSLQVTWENESPNYPEAYFWKWQIGKKSAELEPSETKEAPERSAILKYIQLCQNLTPRKRSAFSLDIYLCKQKESAEVYLKATGEASKSAEESKDE
jgi:hypothetical protein